jgi:hypothetical protein
MPSVFTIKGAASTNGDSCKVIPGDDPKVRKAGKQIGAICRDFRKNLAPLGVDVVLGGSFRSGLAIQPLPGKPWDADIRFLYDGDRKAIIPAIERATGLKYRKSIKIGGGADPISDGHLIEGVLTRNGMRIEVEGALRNTEYVGWQKFYPQVLTPAELAQARRDKLRLRHDKTAYKAFKTALIHKVQRRVKARSLAGGGLGRKMAGRFCERKPLPKTAFDKRSFRYKQSGSSWILIGCPKGKWDAKRETCKVGTRAHVVLRSVCPTCRCRRGEKQTTKG